MSIAHTTKGVRYKIEPELDNLSNILKAFNDQYAGLFADASRIKQRIIEEIPRKVSEDRAYQNARIEHDKALKWVITALFTDDAQLFKQFQDNESFRRWMLESIFEMTYQT